MMEVATFINNYTEAFGPAAELPIVFWYSDSAVSHTEKINGCLFKGIKSVREGKTISLNVDTITCGGGKFYTGFTPMPEHIPNFVSLKERYKKTPEMVLQFIDNMKIFKAPGEYLNFSRIDNIESFDKIEGLLFLATPDVLSGLSTWSFFDNNADDAVTSLFGSGCSAVVTRALTENHKEGRGTFIGFLDPSARPWVEANIISFMIPMSRFKEMYHTMRESSLFDTHAWSKIRSRINEDFN